MPRNVLAVSVFALALLSMSGCDDGIPTDGYSASTAAPSGVIPANEEVHLVGIYEGYEQTGEQIHGPRAVVHVDRPGKNVTLVLTSYSGATWNVQVSEQTKLRHVVLGGYEEQAVTGIPDSTRVTKAYRGETETPLSSTYKMEGQRFRKLVRDVFAITKVDLASFQGTYRPKPNAPIVVKEVQNNPQLSVHYPKPTPLDELPIDARELLFAAHRYAGQRSHSAVTYGEYSLEGPNTRHEPLPRNVKRVAFDTDQNVYYGIAGHGVVRFDPESTKTTEIKLGLEVPKLSWPCEITYDSKRKRVILGSSGGGGYLYAYSTEGEAWSVIAKRPGSLDAFSYSPTDDLIYGVVFERGGNGGNVAKLVTVNEKGAIEDRIPLGPPIHEGSLTTGPGVCTTQVLRVGAYVVIVVEPSEHGSVLSDSYIYLVDPQSRDVWVTSKIPLEMAARE